VLCLLLPGLPWAAAADEPPVDLRERVEYAADGSARSVLAVTAREEGIGELRLPCPFARPASCAVASGPSGLVATLGKEGGRPYIQLRMPQPFFASLTLAVEVTATGVFDPAEAATRDYGNITVQHLFVQTMPRLVASYALELVMPPGFVVKEVDEVFPKAKKEDTVPAFGVTLASDGRRILTQTASNLGLGDRRLLRWRICTGGPRWAVIVLFLALAAGWLYFFRDLIAPPVSGPATNTPTGDPPPPTH